VGRSVVAKTTLLIDADIIAFKYASTNEKKFDWGDGVVSKTVTEDLSVIAKEIHECLQGYLERTKADDFIICLSDDTTNWRNKVLPSYKQHRKTPDGISNRPEWLYPLKEHLARTYQSYRKPTLEADDIMGILSTHPKLIPGRKIIVSEDKDMKTIPGWLWNPRKDKKPWLVTPEVADYWHYLQTLMGDTTDGYKGCPGVGLETADELLKEPYLLVPYEYEFQRGVRKGQTEVRYTKEPTDDVWKAIVSLYESKGLSEYEAITQARVARICRHIDYNFNKQEPIYWNPPKSK
jgi:5'-3' exonuclease